jgi:hypothetical protein
MLSVLPAAPAGVVFLCNERSMHASADGIVFLGALNEEGKMESTES